MNRITRIYLNGGQLKKTGRYRVCEGAPRFSWAVAATHENAAQSACFLRISSEAGPIWESGWVEGERQEYAYTGEALPVETKLFIQVIVRDDRGDEGEPAKEVFYISGLEGRQPDWITASEDKVGRAIYFSKDFRLAGRVKSAVLYACGLGYHKIFLNGEPLGDAELDPLHSDYSKSCYYVMLPDIAERLAEGGNRLGIVVGEGWRRNDGMAVYITDRKLTFYGRPALSASLRIEYNDGRVEQIDTDESWNWRHGAVVENSIFDGETYDARAAVAGWDIYGNQADGQKSAVLAEPPGGTARVMTLEPIVPQEIYSPKTIIAAGKDSFIVDFGMNLAGVCRVRLPGNMESGQAVTLAHAEMLQEDGDIFVLPLRKAKATDRYIAAGDGRDLGCWQPIFTYHGFRYVKITGLPFVSREDISAVSLYSDVNSSSFFSCGSAAVNAIQKMVVQTEKANIMGIMTDCPQRDERQGWLNDATVRFEETPYNFDVGRLFPKVIQDILDAQGEDGSITCTAPYVWGSRPADPVCSSFLVAGRQALLHCGDFDTVLRAYDGYKKWEECLGAHAEGHIVGYSHYGDWAGPEYACVQDGMENPRSAVTPGSFMSTGYYYYNALLLADFAAELDRVGEQRYYEKLAGEIRLAMLEKWWDGDTGLVASGSQACQSFALWLGILPVEGRSLAAKRLHEDLVGNDYRITTGNLCTRYLFDVLTQFGYIEDAWTLITREEYPSFGYMMQNEATTVWERLELKKTEGMNSHNHPMYGAVGYWFYAYLAGIKPAAPGFSKVEIRPCFPAKLLSVQAAVQTVKGEICVRWVRRFGRVELQVSLPFGVSAEIYFGGAAYCVGSGFWSYSIEEGELGLAD